ncbi:MAG: UbiA family prenyltransferase [Verrucomicrobiota bacterium]
MMPEDVTEVPLCVDLDGTFIKSDLLFEGLLRLLRHRPSLVFKLPGWASEGRAKLKSHLAAALPPPASPPPVNTELESFLREEKEKGRKILLVTASHRDALGTISELFPFDGIIATDDHTNLKGEAKAKVLIENFGEKGFDYAGDSSADEAVWDHARKAILVFHSEAKMERLAENYEVDRTFCTNQTSWMDWFRGMRVHQWAKNLLIAVPFLAGHHFQTAWEIAGLFAAFLAMSLCASGTYLWNDLLDLEYDRLHPRKRERLAASGRTSIPRIGLASLALVGGGLLGGFYLNPSFGLLLLGYIVATLSYSLFFKRVALADIFVLAFLYLSRVIGGIIIVPQAVISFWLFAFTFLLFLSLAAAKRHVEIQMTTDKGNDDVQGRGYIARDLPAVSGIGIATGVASCIVLGLYSVNDKVTELYDRPQWLWGICVVALYWISRIWFLTHRSLMHDDPLVFALKDRGTWLLALAGLACVLLAHPLPS